LIYILLSILFSTGLFVIFKYFGIFKIDVLKAIFINYIVAFALGFYFSESKFPLSEVPNQPWFFGAIILGALFISIFFVMAKTAHNNGVSVAAVAGKMSVVIPVLFGLFLYNESVSFLKILGISMAIFAVYLASVKEEKYKNPKASILYPILLFLGSGAIDTLLKYLEKNYVPKEDISVFSGSLFGFAALFGAIIILFNTLKKKESFGLNNIIAGIVLGVPNYFSIIFLIKALQTKGFESSALFTINNVGIVVLSTLVGILLFKEKLSIKNIIGVILAILGIVIVALT
jgi:drug/metabolite transporter (DMT)-like permease